MLGNMTRADFEARLGERFALEDGGVTLTLAEAAAMGSGARDGGAFSLVFEGPEETPLDQAIHRLTGADGEVLEIFLVPIGPFGGGMGYEAVFT